MLTAFSFVYRNTVFTSNHLDLKIIFPEKVTVQLDTIWKLEFQVK